MLFMVARCLCRVKLEAHDLLYAHYAYKSRGAGDPFELHGSLPWQRVRELVEVLAFDDVDLKTARYAG